VLLPVSTAHHHHHHANFFLLSERTENLKTRKGKLRRTCGGQIAHNGEVNAGGGAFKSPKGTSVYWVLCAVFWALGLTLSFLTIKYWLWAYYKIICQKVQLKEKKLSLKQITFFERGLNLASREAKRTVVFRSRLIRLQLPLL
jgi:hypothetical protein